MVKADSYSNDRQKPDTKFIIKNDQADSSAKLSLEDDQSNQRLNALQKGYSMLHLNKAL